MAKTMEKQDIKSLDDLSHYFFEVAKEIGHPIKDIRIELTDTWGNRTNNIKS